MSDDLARILELESFLNVWFWLFLAYAWSRATYFSLGVPFHEARMAYDREGKYMTDFETLMRINVEHYTEMFDQYGPFLIAILAFFLATIATLGFGFKYQIMQATFALVLPLSIATLFSLRFAYRLRSSEIRGIALCRAYFMHRRLKQILGFMTLIIMAFWTGVRIMLFL